MRVWITGAANPAWLPHHPCHSPEEICDRVPNCNPIAEELERERIVPVRVCEIEGGTEKRKALQGQIDNIRRVEGKRSGRHVGAAEISKELAECHKLQQTDQIH